MKTLTREIRSLPNRVLFWERGRTMKTLTKEVRALPERVLFWVGVLLLTSGVLKVEDLAE